MMHKSWFAPAALLAGLASTPALAHGSADGGAIVAVGIPAVIVDVGEVHVVVGAPPPPVVVQHAPPPPVVVVREAPRVVEVREVPRSTVVVYPRHRAPPPAVREVIVVEDRCGCGHPGQHRGHHKHHGKGKHGRDHRDDDGRRHERDDDDRHGYWR